MVNRPERIGWLDRFVKYYDPQKIDMPVDYLSAMAELEARVGNLQCRSYHAIVSHRRRLAAIYRNGLANLKGLQLPPDDAGATYSHFVLRCEKASEIKNKILQHGIQLGDLIDYYIPSMESYTNCKVIGSGKSASLPAEVVNLPVHMGMSEADAVRLIDLIRQEFDI